MVKVGEMDEHIMKEHVNKPCIFCPYCKYSVTYGTINVREHVTRRHPEEPVRVINKMKNLVHEYKIWLKICFPDAMKQPAKRSSRANDEAEEHKNTLVRWLVFSFHKCNFSLNSFLPSTVCRCRSCIVIVEIF